MSQLMIILIFASLIGLIAFTIYRYLKSKNVRNLIIHLFLIIIYILVFFGFVFFNNLTPKGGQDEHIYLIIALYIFMILGMLAHYGYNRLSQPAKTRKKFDLGYFIAPVLVSPIIFFPLLATLQSVNIEIETFNIKLLFFCVAFENGFFWKEFCDNRRQDKEGTGNDKK
jgi:hypothetical protein